MATTSQAPPQVCPLSALSSHISVKTLWFCRIKRGRGRASGKLVLDRKNQRFTGAAVGNNKEETNPDPNNPNWAPTQPLQRWWDVPGGVKSKRKLLGSINTHFPYTTNKLQQHPAGYFQVTTSFLPYPSAKIRNSLEKLLPRKTQLLMEGRAGRGQGKLRCQGCSSHSRPWNFHFFFGTKQTRCKQQLLPRQRRHPRLNPTTSKQLFVNK